MSEVKLQRTLEQWRNCDPKMMANAQSPAAVQFAIADAKRDLAALAAANRALREDRDSHQRACIAAMEERDRQSVITGEYIHMNWALREERDKLRAENERLRVEMREAADLIEQDNRTAFELLISALAGKRSE